MKNIESPNNLFDMNEDLKNLKTVIFEFIEDYEKKQHINVENWLYEKMHKELPDESSENINRMIEETSNSFQVFDEKTKSLERATINGQSKESWVANELRNACVAAGTNGSAVYMDNLSNAINTTNENLRNSVITNSGFINQNPNFDGIYAEHHHAESFNLSATARGDNARAVVNNRNNSNSVDVTIKNNGKNAQNYQLKYGGNSGSTTGMACSGDYRGQRILVPKEQVNDVKNNLPNKTVTDKIEYEGAESTALSKKEGRERAQELQNGEFQEWDWNMFRNKDIARGFGKKVVENALLSLTLDLGVNTAKKLLNNEKITPKELVVNSLKSSSSSALKMIVAGALKVSSEKGLIKAIPKGSPMSRISAIVHLAIENTKIAYDISTSKITFREGMDKMIRTSISMTMGLIASSKASVLGASLTSVLGPAGAIIGGFVGSCIGYAAGSTIGQSIGNASSKIISGVKDVCHSCISTVKSVGSRISIGLKSIGSAIGNFL